MKRLLLLTLSLFAFLGSLFGSVAQVFAQEVAASDAATIVDSRSGQIWRKDDLAEQILDVKAQYQSLLQDYLIKDKAYRVALAQNKELNTLASIEDLLQKSKQLGLSRDETMSSYFSLLRLHLISTEGIELSIKNDLLNRLEERRNYFQDHQQRLSALTERSDVENLLLEFRENNKDTQSLADAVLAALAVGKLQVVYDRSQALKLDINSYLEEEGRTEQAAVVRASKETDKSLESAKVKLDEFWAKALQGYTKQNFSFLADTYNNLPSEMNPLYVNLSQSLSYLAEILKF